MPSSPSSIRYDRQFRVIGRRGQRGVEDLVVGQDQQAGELAPARASASLRSPFIALSSFGAEKETSQDRPMARGLAMRQRDAVG
jgi:hypothetical protein